MSNTFVEVEVAGLSCMSRGHKLLLLHNSAMSATSWCPNPLCLYFCVHLCRWEVEVAGLSYMSRGHKLVPLFGLTFRRSSLQHPLLAGALGE